MNRSGNPFTEQHLRSMAVKHAYAGLRNHKGTIYEGTWDGLVEKEIFWDVQRILSDPSRKTTRGGRAVHEISMIIKSGVCGGRLEVSKDYGKKDSNKLVYKCQKDSCVQISKDETDKFVIGAMLGYLARPGLYELLATPGGDSADVQRTRDALSQARASMAEMEDATPESLAEARVLGRAA